MNNIRILGLTVLTTMVLSSGVAQAETECAKKSETATIESGATAKLEGKSGCMLKLGDNEPVKLYTEMVCTIKDGKLTCDLL